MSTQAMNHLTNIVVEQGKGIIKANFPARSSFAVASSVDSRRRDPLRFAPRTFCRQAALVKYPFFQKQCKIVAGVVPHVWR